MKLDYDTTEQVTEKQYNAIMSKLGSVCAGVRDGDIFYIKLWLTKYRKYVLDLIKNN